MDDDIMPSSSDIHNNNNNDNNNNNTINTNHKYNTPKTTTRLQLEEESFYQKCQNLSSSTEGDDDSDNIWALLSGVCGNIYEWYDFAVYGFMAPEIGNTFFPDTLSPEIQLLNSFGVYLAAFFMRPLGAIVFGEMGDRTVGRKHALLISIILITVPSVLMGLLPGYEAWGAASPILLVVLRMMQGLSVGGQLAGSYVLTLEQSPPASRGFRGAVCDASATGGLFVASVVTSVVRHVLSPEQVDEWAWRIPFWFSLVLAPILYAIVRRTKESKAWTESQHPTKKVLDEVPPTADDDDDDDNSDTLMKEQEQPKKKGMAIVDIAKSPFQRRQLLGMIGVLAGFCSNYYLLFLWIPVYLSEIRGFTTEAQADLLNTIVVAVYMVLLLIQGRWSDTMPHRRDLLRIGLPGLIVATPVLMYLLEATCSDEDGNSNLWYIFIAQLLMTVCLSMVQGCIGSYEVESWMADPTVSYTGVAIGHNLAAMLFGGTLPLIATSLVVWTGNKNENDDSSSSSSWWCLAPGLYLSILACVSLYCVSNLVRHPHDIRTGVHHADNYHSLVDTTCNETKPQETTPPAGWMEQHPFVYSTQSGNSSKSQQQQQQQQQQEPYQPPVL